MSDRAIETLLDEERRFPPDPAFAAQANAQPDIYDLDPDAFWEREGRERVSWFTPFETLSEWEPPFAKWYLGGTLNVATIPFQVPYLKRHLEQLYRAGFSERDYQWLPERESRAGFPFPFHAPTSRLPAGWKTLRRSTTNELRSAAERTMVSLTQTA